LPLAQTKPPPDSPEPEPLIPRVSTIRLSDHMQAPPQQVGVSPTTYAHPFVGPNRNDRVHKPTLYTNGTEPRSDVDSNPIGSRTARPNPSKRSSTSRPPSMHSITSTSGGLRLHPLIRGQSSGNSVNNSPTPAAVAPLTVTSDAVTAQLSSSPQQSAPVRVSSPTSMRISSDSSPSPPHRRPSISSLRSANNLLAAHQTDHHRTLSTMSSSSTNSMTVLSSFAHLPVATRPSTPQKVVHFPPSDRNTHPGTIHPLLPPPYMNPHLTVLAHRIPIRESYERVIRAKEGR
jgi:hypothetical protein